MKLIEEKLRKDRLWKIEATFNSSDFSKIQSMAVSYELPYNYVDLGKHVLFNFYCGSKKDSNKVKGIINAFNGKYFITESSIIK